jgi:hypothetical protein
LSVQAFSAQNYENQYLKGKLGIGFNAQDIGSNGSKALAARYWLTDLVGVEGFLGFYTGGKDEDNGDYIFGGKLLSIIKSYSNFNSYVSVSLNISQNSSNSYTTMGLAAGLGVEYFIFDRLSLSSEIGCQFNFEDSKLRVGTYADVIPQISVKFYL